MNRPTFNESWYRVASLRPRLRTTVQTHRQNLMDKLNLRSVAALTKYAIREGITSLDD